MKNIDTSIFLLLDPDPDPQSQYGSGSMPIHADPETLNILYSTVEVSTKVSLCIVGGSKIIYFCLPDLDFTTNSLYRWQQGTYHPTIAGTVPYGIYIPVILHSKILKTVKPNTVCYE
jgi:hypothetical protein